MMRSAWSLALAAFLAFGCAPARPPDVRGNLNAIRRETTEDKLVERGEAFAAVGDWTRAEQYLAASLDRGSDPERVLPLLMRVCIEAEKYRVAADYARDYLRKKPDDVPLRMLLGSLEAAIGNRQAARREMRAVIDRQPSNADAHFELALLLRDDDVDPEEANRHFREYLRLTPAGSRAPQARAALLEGVQ
jgi:tetratricopeptide (TPR) repeat protein